MCDVIELPDETELYSIDEDGTCLCGHTQKEILCFIVSKLPEIEFDHRIVIDRSCFGWHVLIKQNTSIATEYNIEKISEKVHNAWMKQEAKHGRHAPINCPDIPEGVIPDRNGRYCKNCHWDMYPYSELIEDHKDYDRDTVKAVLSAIESLEKEEERE